MYGCWFSFSIISSGGLPIWNYFHFILHQKHAENMVNYGLKFQCNVLIYFTKILNLRNSRNCQFSDQLCKFKKILTTRNTIKLLIAFSNWLLFDGKTCNSNNKFSTFWSQSVAIFVLTWARTFGPYVGQFSTNAFSSHWKLPLQAKSNTIYFAKKYILDFNWARSEKNTKNEWNLPNLDLKWKMETTHADRYLHHVTCCHVVFEWISASQ